MGATNGLGVFLRQVRHNWPVITCVITLSFLGTVTFSTTQNAVADQGKRLTIAESQVLSNTVKISAIDERSRITLETVQRIDEHVTEIMREDRK